jgi:intracellular sulfur oxidation DsrE/DsrF family protein
MEGSEMSDLKRRGFLGALAAGAASLGISALAKPMPVTSEPEGVLPGADHTDFETWLGKIKGKHRQVFDAPGLHEGMPLAWSRVFLMTNKQVGVPDEEMTAVLILRHDSIPVALHHDVWSKYKLGEVFKVTDKATSSSAVRNPYFRPKPGELLLPDMSVEELLKSGVLIGVCDMALTVYSRVVAKDLNVDGGVVKKDWVAGVLPGIQIVPSGVLAVNRAQEHHCTYCYAG